MMTGTSSSTILNTSFIFMTFELLKRDGLLLPPRRSDDYGKITVGLAHIAKVIITVVAAASTAAAASSTAAASTAAAVTAAARTRV